MASGNANYTYVGDEPTITISGQTFTRNEPTHVTDNGVIAMVSERADFEDADKPHRKPKKHA